MKNNKERMKKQYFIDRTECKDGAAPSHRQQGKGKKMFLIMAMPKEGAVSKARKSNQYAVIGSPHTPFGTGSAKQSLTQNALIVRDCFSRTSFAMTALIVARSETLTIEN